MIKVLFFLPTLGSGGAERVLVNLVNNIDPTRFDVTVKTLFDIGSNRALLSPKVKYEACMTSSEGDYASHEVRVEKVPSSSLYQESLRPRNLLP